MTRAGGRPVPLGSVAEIQQGSGPVMLERKYLQRIVEVTANVAPAGTSAPISADAGGAVPRPCGAAARLHGAARRPDRAAARGVPAARGFAALLALVLVYMVLASQFKSLLDPLVIMFSVPLGVIGVFWALFLTNTTLSVNSFMGIIMMVGIVVSNGVLLVDFANVLRRHGLGLHEAVMRAGRTRLRPILMTSHRHRGRPDPHGARHRRGQRDQPPLARAVIGGLTVSTMLTLVLIPTLYVMLEERFPRRVPAMEGAPALQGDPA